MAYEKKELETIGLPSQSDDTRDKKNSEQIKINQDRAQQIKANLYQILEAVNANQSLFSRAARFWNSIPLWQKIAVGLLLSLPFLIIGIITSLASLITVSLVSALIFTAASMLLDNHENENKRNTKALDALMSNLVSMLNSVMSLLERLSEELGEEIRAFGKENWRLNGLVSELSEKNKSLETQIEKLHDTQTKLTATRENLENIIFSLKNSNKEQSILIQKNQYQLEQAIKQYTEQENQLSQQIKDLEAIVINMTKARDQALSNAHVLKDTLITFSESMVAGREKRGMFQLELDEFLTNKGSQFEKLTQHMIQETSNISEISQELSLGLDRLYANQQRYFNLLERYKQCITILEERVELYERKIVLLVKERPDLYAFFQAPHKPSQLPEPSESTWVLPHIQPKLAMKT